MVKILSHDWDKAHIMMSLNMELERRVGDKLVGGCLPVLPVPGVHRYKREGGLCNYLPAWNWFSIFLTGSCLPCGYVALRIIFSCSEIAIPTSTHRLS